MDQNKIKLQAQCHYRLNIQGVRVIKLKYVHVHICIQVKDIKFNFGEKETYKTREFIPITIQTHKNLAVLYKGYKISSYSVKLYGVEIEGKSLQGSLVLTP